ncbi:MAG: glycosyltransferase family 2 protein [Sphingomicrobium sp.]
MLQLLLAIIVIPPVILTTCFAVEVLAGLRRLRSCAAPSAPASAIIIIPAHNEEISIAATVAALSAATVGVAELLVVADNCTDRTAELTLAAGARVIVRDDSALRGKGYALAFARDELSTTPPDVVLIVDADCRIDRAGVMALISAVMIRSGPVQSVNLLCPDLDAAPFVQVSNFAFMLRNLVRQRGLQRMAERVHLTGTGMAFPWSLFAKADLGGASIVEDLNLGVTLAAQGHPAILVEEATVWSAAASAKDTLQQRERWEGGFLTSALPVGIRGFWRSAAKLDGRSMVAAIDLCIPPLVVLGLLDIAALIVLGLAAALGGSVYPFVAILSASALAGCAVVLAWLREGRAFASLGAIASIPVYAVRKLPIYARLLIRGAPRDWVRTDRVQ